MMAALLEYLARNRQNRNYLLFIVYIALFLDNMLLTTVVPIIPEYLVQTEHPNETYLLHKKIPTEERRPPKKRQITWDDDAWKTDYGDGGQISWKQNPLLSRPTSAERPRQRPKNVGRPGDSRERMRVTTTQRPKEEIERELDEAERQARKVLLARENIYVGLMFGSKALVQLLTNPWIGPLTNKIGYTIPMFAGFVIMFLSTVMFAFGSSFRTLWFARALQGIGSACTSSSGMGMLAQAYPDDLERGSAMGIALGGLALGVLVGPPYGGVLYQWSGKELPFILLALLALFDGTLQFFVLQPRVDRGEEEGTAIKELAKDPYIIVAAGAITIGNLGIAIMEPSLPLWMMESWQANSFERGAAFLPASISYLIGTNIFGPLAHKIGRWLSGFLGLIIIGFCLLAVPFAKSVGGLIAPNLFMGFSIGMIDASMFPQMGYLVDIRHVGVYGSIYAIADAAFCFAFALGPFFSGPLVSSVGFPTMMYLIAMINFAYAPLMFFLRNPPVRNRGSGQTGLNSAGGKAISSTSYENLDGTTTTGALDPGVTRLGDYQYEY